MVKKCKESTWLREYYHDKFQRIKRNPEYVEFARKIVFDQNGFESDLSCFNMDQDAKKKAESFRRKFGLNSLFDPTIEISKDDFLEELVFENQSPVEIILREDRPNFFDSIWNDSHIKLKIDIRPEVSLNQILSEVKEFIEEARELLPDYEEKSRRAHFEKREDYYKIWDLRTERMSFKDIALKLKIKESTAVYGFKCAYKLILGESYDKRFWTELMRKNFENNIIKADGSFSIDHWKKLSKLEETKQTSRLFYETEPAISHSTENQIEEFENVESIKETCQRCSDDDYFKEMLRAFKQSDFESWNACPDIYTLLKNKNN
jgi:hypothetical protein